MIGKIEQTGRYVAVTGGPAGNYVNNTGYMGVGQLQYNTNTQQLEVYNGLNWQPVNLGIYHVGLNEHAENLLDWVSKRRDEEAEARRMAEQYPAVADALNAVWESEQQLKTIVALCRT